MRLGILLFGIGSVAAGVLDLVWGEFEPNHQSIQALSDHIPGVRILAYVAAVWLIAGGAAIVFRRTGQAGAAALGILYAIFGLFLLPRIYTAPHFLGYRATVFIGLFVGIAQQLILVVAAAVVWAHVGGRRSLSAGSTRLVRW